MTRFVYLTSVIIIWEKAERTALELKKRMKTLTITWGYFGRANFPFVENSVKSTIGQSKTVQLDSFWTTFGQGLDTHLDTN